MRPENALNISILASLRDPLYREVQSRALPSSDLYPLPAFQAGDAGGGSSPPVAAARQAAGASGDEQSEERPPKAA